MSESKIQWLRENCNGMTHYHETKVYIIFYDTENPKKTIKVKKPEWMI